MTPLFGDVYDIVQYCRNSRDRAYEWFLLGDCLRDEWCTDDYIGHPALRVFIEKLLKEANNDYNALYKRLVCGPIELCFALDNDKRHIVYKWRLVTKLVVNRYSPMGLTFSHAELFDPAKHAYRRDLRYTLAYDITNLGEIFDLTTEEEQEQEEEPIEEDRKIVPAIRSMVFPVFDALPKYKQTRPSRGSKTAALQLFKKIAADKKMHETSMVATY